MRLDAEDGPLITRDWTPFTSGAKNGLGRWGLYMEPATLFLGVPGSDYPGLSYISLGGWMEDGTRSDWLTVNNKGNVGIGMAPGLDENAAKLSVNGHVSAKAFDSVSDRHAKENLRPVDPRAVLEKVASLPISRWNFIDTANQEHLGPMAQDFYAAFGLGADERHIATVDADGVALAAIQGLNLRVHQLDGRNRELEQLNRDLLKRLERLEHLQRVERLEQVERRLADLEATRSPGNGPALHTATSPDTVPTQLRHE